MSQIPIADLTWWEWGFGIWELGFGFMLTLADVYEALSGRRVDEWQSLKVSSFCVDSRKCQANSLFVALQGEQTDGHLFIADALARGAQFVIAERQRLEIGDWRLGSEHATLIDLTGPVSTLQSPITNLQLPITLL